MVRGKIKRSLEVHVHFLGRSPSFAVEGKYLVVPLVKPIEVFVKEFTPPVQSDAPVAKNLPVNPLYLLVLLIERGHIERSLADCNHGGSTHVSYGPASARPGTAKTTAAKRPNLPAQTHNAPPTNS